MTTAALGGFSAFLECIEQDVVIIAERVKQLRGVHHAAAVRMSDDA
jgi:hypothetical protein